VFGKVKRRLFLGLIHWSAVVFDLRISMKAHRILLGWMGAKTAGDVYVSESFHVHKPRNLTLGDRCFMSANARIVAYDGIVIGDDFLAAEDLLMNSGTHDVNTIQPRTGKITIGDRVWCGARVTICAGVTIGSDVVIGAGSVVVSDIPSGVVAVGVPCKPLRGIHRPDPSTYWNPFASVR
jgi:acetyltransferase-like isoleucine patch superfamily enzyme